MPITQSAKKKVRQDAKRTKRNDLVRDQYKSAVKKARLESNKKNVSLAYQAIDMAAKKDVIHKNKASRLKARLAKLRASKTTPTKQPTKKKVKKIRKKS